LIAAAAGIFTNHGSPQLLYKHGAKLLLKKKIRSLEEGVCVMKRGFHALF